jgi:hypothetical protein
VSLRALAPGGLLSLLALGAACENQGKATGATTTAATTTAATTTGASGTTTKTGGAAADFCAPATVVTTPFGSAAFEVTTPHYRLYAEVAPDEAVEMGRLLEAAFPAFAAWFRAAPSGGLLRVNVYANETAWEAGLGADGIVAPTEAGGYYSQSTKTAYLYAQANPYYTHVLLLHEATHQFHELSRTKGQVLPFWYAEGHAEYLSRHDWDGRCVRLGVIPLLSWEDLPAQALRASASPGIDVPALVSGASTPSREAAWALFRYLDTGPRHDAFRAFRDAFDAGDRDPARGFASLVADPATLSAPLAAWLPSAQEPMKPVFTEWAHRGPHAITGDSPGYFSQAVLKARVTHFEAKYDVPSTPTWALGLVLGYQDDQTYQAILVSADGRLRTFTAGAGSARWSDAGTAPPDSAGTGSLSVDFGAASAKLTVNGAVSSHALTGLPVVAGLSLSDARVSFHDLAWR